MFKALVDVSGCGDWIDAPVSPQLTLTGTSYETHMDLVPLGALPGQRIPRSGPGEGEALGWAVWSAGPQQRWTHRYCWTADRAGRPRTFQRFPGEGKTAGHLYHTHLFLYWGTMQWHVRGMWVLLIYYITLNKVFILRHLKNLPASMFLAQIK